MLTASKPSILSARKTAYRHYSALLKTPIPGVSITQIDADKFHVTTRVMEGVYEGILVHWELSINENYPYSPPFGRMVSGYEFDGRHHHHIFESAGICADFLGNFAYMQQSATAGTGWTSSCDFIGLMINMQAFFADPDGMEASKVEIRKLRLMDKEFVCMGCDHSTKEPYPPLNLEIEAQEEEEKLDPIMERAKRELFCSITKRNVIDDSLVCLGYPLEVRRDSGGRIQSTLHPELISYEAYMDEYSVSSSQYRSMRTASGSIFTNWLPIYVNEERFKSHFNILTTTISVISRGEGGNIKNDFQPWMVLQVFPALMNKQVVQIMQGKVFESESCIVAYVHLLRIFKRLIHMYPSIQNQIDSSVKGFLNDEDGRSKRYCKDLGEFLIKLFLTTDHKNGARRLTYNNGEMKQVLIGEHLARQVRWIRQTNSDDLKSLFKEGLSIQQKTSLLARIFGASLTSNRLFVFNLEITKKFIRPDFCAKLDRCYGIPPANVVSSFQNRVKLIKARLNSYSTLMSACDVKFIKSRDDMVAALQRAVQTSSRKGYDTVYKRPQQVANNNTYRGCGCHICNPRR
ncbi:hypothetical protein HK103_004884 [Boothiomyces macroporosus]|uniref:UBC core domain-containing protein n=1 Tax=Boothiomyces macroporosus TaxID=261099 RepID=A0AAD5UIZ8_9FUNG|nr:hypothetical protein HK103_004884 [Boothiomyces macroporosus]